MIEYCTSGKEMKENSTSSICDEDGSNLQDTTYANKNARDVEISSLNLIRYFNEHGVYLIKNHNGDDWQSLKCFESLIMLQCETDNVLKSYSFAQIKELLILVERNETKFESLNVKNDTEELDYFIDAFNGVVMIAELLLCLMKKGCTLFKNFELLVYCDIKNKRIAHEPSLTFKIRDSSLSHNDNIKNCLLVFRMFLESCLKMWREQVSRLRDLYDKINYFTLNQIVFLVDSFQSILNNNEYDAIKLNYMLHVLCPNFNAEILRKSFEESAKILKENKSMLIVYEAKNFETAETFKKDIQSLWNEFMNKQTDDASQEISVTRLAIILELIATESLASKFQRDIPSYLTHHGEPNLITCSREDQIAAVLSIYALTPECPLPSNDEVLFCTSKTTKDEVVNFLRVALKSDGKKIYTLVNIDSLSNECAKKADKNFGKLKATNSYILVVVCDIEKATESILASSFAKYKISPFLMQTNKLVNYMDQKLSADEPNGLIQHYACNIEPNGNCVKVLRSVRSGVGKTLFVKNLIEKNQIQDKRISYFNLPIKRHALNIDTEIETLFHVKKHSVDTETAVYHIDIANEVIENVDEFVFNLTVLGYLKHSNGTVWRRSSKDLYFIEVMPVFTISDNKKKYYHKIYEFLPKIDFREPKRYLYDLENDGDQSMTLDANFNRIYSSDNYQRTCKYLDLIQRNSEDLDSYKFNNDNEVIGEAKCLKMIMQQSGLKDPTWSEINNFVRFLTEQFFYLDNNPLFDSIPGFKDLFLKCLLLMSQDFALSNLNFNEDNPRLEIDDENYEFDLTQMHINRCWNRISHPYIIFDDDALTLNFMGLYCDRKTYKLLDANTNQPLENFDYRLNMTLRRTFLEQRIPIYRNFNESLRLEKIRSLRNVMGLNDTSKYAHFDPDSTYELNIENCLKIIAIYLRFKCDIPVILMGETGCGKTRLIKFMCDLFKPNNTDIKILVHVKTHGGTTEAQIEDKLKQAEKLSKINYDKLEIKEKVQRQPQPFGFVPVTCVLFFDGANTTESIGLLKEIMCDKTCKGRAVDFKWGLKIIAACNPYKKHSEGMIAKLEQTGLGFYKSANDTKDKLGQIPMRQLVYRVQPLPPSMLPLVWDFGQLSNTVEEVYIKQIIKKAVRQIAINDTSDEEIKLICKLLVSSQDFMRNCSEECSYVSLRNIERVIKVAEWFIEKKSLIFTLMDKRKINNLDDSYQVHLKPLMRAFVLALVVCYHASLQASDARLRYRQTIAEIISIDVNDDWIMTEILKCQNVFLDSIELNTNIARSAALLENVFMMTICIELRIPLFIVGKPGCSKSLAKSIIAGAMRGEKSKSEFYRNFKDAHFVNLQCSPLTTPEMIVKAFSDAVEFQENKNFNTSVAVVFMDQIGLAEASDSMPLEALHSLLDSDEEALPYQKVGLIGISNWSLDPAKMNQGIFVSRGNMEVFYD